MSRSCVEADLLFGLRTLQNGQIPEKQLLAAIRAWSADEGRTLADHLAALDAAGKPPGTSSEDAATVADAIVNEAKPRNQAAAPADLTIGATLDSAGAVNLAQTLAIDDPARDSNGGDRADFALGTSAPVAEGRRFRILRPHAKGGLGAVFVAMDQELHREVALKQILDRHADEPISRARFLLEAEVTGGLEHPGIVPVYSLGSDAAGRPYYAMRFIRGDSLKEAIDRFHAAKTGPVEQSKAHGKGHRPAGLAESSHPTGDPGRRMLELHKLLRRFTDICNAIDYAHSRGVLHRDIKPANVIVGKHGETLVVDWGLAKVMGRSDPEAASEEPVLMPSQDGGSADTLPGHRWARRPS